MPRERGQATLAVTGIGMVTPVGLDAWESCASLRAGLTLMQDLDYAAVENDKFEQVPLVGCPVAGVTDGSLGLGRWTKLAARAVEDLLKKAALERGALAQARLFIALPPIDRPGVDPRIADQLGVRLAEWLDVPALAQRTRVYTEGHAGALQAVLDAQRELGSGLELAIVGGVDSLLEPETLQGLLDKRRLKTEENPDGLIPGEAAAFFSLERPERAKERGVEAMALLQGVGTGREPNPVASDRPSQATGLSEAMGSALAALPNRGADVRLLVCDLNGESYRAREFGTAAARSLAHLTQPWTLWHPADSIGDTGAASAAISTCVAARALQRGYARAPRALVFSGSDAGLRGALTLAAAV